MTQLRLVEGGGGDPNAVEVEAETIRTRKVKPEVVPGPESEAEPGPGPGPERSHGPSKPPRPPGAVPLELAQLLRRGEAIVWWGAKDQISWRPVLWTLLAGLLLLAAATVFAPAMWSRPLDEAWPPVAATLAPAALVTVREYLSLRMIGVTDTSVIALPRFGSADRIAFRNVDVVRTDLLTGGVLLEGAAHKVRIPPGLMEDTRAAIASQTRNAIRSGDGPDDRLGWLPLA